MKYMYMLNIHLGILSDARYPAKDLTLLGDRNQKNTGMQAGKWNVLYSTQKAIARLSVTAYVHAQTRSKQRRLFAKQ